MCLHPQNPTELVTARLWFVLQTRGCQFSLLNKHHQAPPTDVHTNRGEVFDTCMPQHYSLEVFVRKRVVTAVCNVALDAPCLV